MRAFLASLALASAVLAVVLVSSPSGDGKGAPSRPVDQRFGIGPAQIVEPFRFFSPKSFWNTPVEAATELDPGSESVVANFVAEIDAELGRGRGPGISTTSYSVPIYTVAANQPTVPVHLVSDPPAPALQAAWKKVPLPADAEPSEGTDGSLAVWQPSTERLWEFWRLGRTPDGSWQAAWGGAMEDVSKAPGVFGPRSWPGAQPFWGSSASSLSIVGGLITLEDLRQGRINHALAIAVPMVRAGVFSAPARRTDGRSSNPISLPEGAHLRIDPTLNLDELQMPRVTRILAEAAQRYGIFVRDGAGVAHFFAQDPVTTGRDPYLGPDGYFEGSYPGELLASFPWDHLQLLPMRLHPFRGKSRGG